MELRKGDRVNLVDYFGAKVIAVAKDAVKVEHYHPSESRPIRRWVRKSEIIQGKKREG